MRPAAVSAGVAHGSAERHVDVGGATPSPDSRSGQHNHLPKGRPHSGVERGYRPWHPDPSNLACRDRSLDRGATSPRPATRLLAARLPESGPPRCQTPDSRLDARCHRGSPPGARTPKPQSHPQSSAQSPGVLAATRDRLETDPRSAPELREHRPRGFGLGCSNQGPPNKASPHRASPQPTRTRSGTARENGSNSRVPPQPGSAAA